MIIDQFYVDNRSMIVLIKHRTKALNVHHNWVQGSPSLRVRCTQCIHKRIFELDRKESMLPSLSTLGTFDLQRSMWLIL